MISTGQPIRQTPSLEALNGYLHDCGESVRRFFREQQRSAMISPLFNLPGRLILGSYCYYENLRPLLLELLQHATPEAIGRDMRKLGSRANSIHRKSLMLGYFNGREQLRLLGKQPQDDVDELALILDFWARAAMSYRSDGSTFSAPHLDLISIGSGGGSIIWLDEKTGGLKVGPESAGANPGPACYGRGGTRPAVTDADLILGYYNPDYFLGGKLQLDKAAATSAMDRVGRMLGMTAVETAAGAVQIVEFQMAELMRQMTVERGFDPRDFVVYSYGGAAGAHVAEYTRELGCRRVVVPLGATASTWSALGVQAADLLHVYEKSRLFMAPFPSKEFNQIFEELERQARLQLHKDGLKESDIAIERAVEMKFKLQIHTVEVPLRCGKLSDQHVKELETEFIEKYERTHGRGSAFTAAGIEIGLFRVRARGRIRRPSLQKRTVVKSAGAIDRREVYWRRFKAFRTTPIYDGAQLKTNAVLKGPAIVQLPETTIVVPPRDEGHFDGYGNFILTLSD